jgi:hypothetical protein
MSGRRHGELAFFADKFLTYWLLASRTASKDFVDMLFDPKTLGAPPIS